VPFLTLAHLIGIDRLRAAYRRMRRAGASGVEGVTAEEYAANLEANLADLHEQLRRERYDAPPVKRIYVAQEDGSQQPIGIPRVRG
jgi:retron-type reverse transcriptase